MGETDDQIRHEALIEAMRKKGVMPPRYDQRRELGLVVVCDACGSIVGASWVAVNGARQMVIVVEKCPCDSPLIKEASGRVHESHCGLRADHEGKCSAVVTRLLGV